MNAKLAAGWRIQGVGVPSSPTKRNQSGGSGEKRVGNGTQKGDSVAPGEDTTPFSGHHRVSRLPFTLATPSARSFSLSSLLLQTGSGCPFIRLPVQGGCVHYQRIYRVVREYRMGSHFLFFLRKRINWRLQLFRNFNDSRNNFMGLWFYTMSET